MAFTVKNRTKQTSTTNGTTNVVMTGSVSGFQTFGNALSDGDTTYYAIVDPANGTWEVGLGTWASGTSTLTRTTIIESSSGSSAINFTGSVSKDVFITEPASKSLLEGSSAISNAEFLKKNGNVIEGRSASEVRSDLNVEDGATANSAGNAISISSGVINHSDTSSQASSNNSGRTYIQDITLDTYGHVTGLATATETVTDTNTTYSAGSGINLSGTTFSHSDTSSQSSSNNSGRTYIQDITLDTYGHVTGIATATETVTNTDTNTTYSAGTNLGLSGTTFNLDNSITLSGTVQATRFYVDGTSKFIDSNSGNHGSIRVEGNTYAGYAIRDDWVFMSNGADASGIYNDTDNEWSARFLRNSYVELRHNGTESFRTLSGGARVKSTSNSNDGYLYLGDTQHSFIHNDEGSYTRIATGAAENFIQGNENANTYLYYNGSWRLRTNGYGITVINSTTADGTIYLGSNAHSKIYNDEGTAIYIDTGADEKTFYGQENSYTYLYYNGSWRLRASNQGITINGALATGASDTAYGTSGQVLKSNGSSAPTWVSPSTLSGVGGVWEEVSNTNFSGVTQVNISVSTGYLYNIIFSDLLITSSTNAARFDFKAITSSSTLQGFRASRNRISNSTSLQTYYTNILQTSNIALGYSNNVARQNNGTKSQTFNFWYHQGSTNTSNNNWASFWCTGWGQGAITVNPVVDICHGYQYQSGGATIATLGFFASTTTIQGNYRVLRIQV